MSAAIERTAIDRRLDEALAFVERALADDAARNRPLAITVSAPLAPLESIFADTEPVLEPDAFLWDSPGARASGFGRAYAIEACGSERFDTVAAAARELARTLITRSAVAATAKLFGGFSFEPDPRARAGGAPWEAFGAASFTLPRWTYQRVSSTEAALTLSLDGDQQRIAARILPEVEAIFTRLAIAATPPQARAVELVAVLTEPSLADWAQQIEAICEAIDRRELEKLVPARRTWVIARAPWNHRAVIARLAGTARGARFAFHRVGSTFCGLTPERLLVKRGEIAESEAVAGTATPAELGELYNEKNAEEHAIVVRAIAERLSRVAREVQVAEVPQARRLGHLAHLVTPISARSEDRHLVELAGALHPTPAVSGAPAADAERWIAEREPYARGWYAGPVGWFDTRGDGELYVALRSALIRDRSALLWAGAGIVAGSSPVAEYKEARLKERTMRLALGVEP